jgi:transcriptional regulator with XRE-family HTH domain
MQTSPMQTFSSNVRGVIDQKALTITELAENIGMPREALSKILNGRVDPTTGTLQRIADGLGVQLWELLKPETKEKRKAEKVA